VNSVRIYSLALIILIVPVHTCKAGTLDRFAGFVNSEVITESMIDIERCFLASDVWTSKPETPDKKTVLNRLIDRKLILAEAHRFISVDETSIDTEMERYKNKAGGEEALRKMLSQCRISEQEFRLYLRDTILFKAYIDQRIRAFVQVRTRDIETYIQENAENLGVSDLDNGVPDTLKSVIKRFLEESAVNERLDELVKTLRVNADIKILPE
jgi:LPS O-antigen subunit length determinant protein (WzzB/FepE family)